jgi:hypothetical protein
VGPNDLESSMWVRMTDRVASDDIERVVCETGGWPKGCVRMTR